MCVHVISVSMKFLSYYGFSNWILPGNQTGWAVGISWALGLPGFELFRSTFQSSNAIGQYIIHKRLPKQRCSPHFIRPEKKKKNVLNTFPDPSPNPNPIPNSNP